jgi:hypothetical protein
MSHDGAAQDKDRGRTAPRTPAFWWAAYRNALQKLAILLQASRRLSVSVA